jgi:hypothetical protein
MPIALLPAPITADTPANKDYAYRVIGYDAAVCRTCFANRRIKGSNYRGTREYYPAQPNPDLCAKCVHVPGAPSTPDPDAVIDGTPVTRWVPRWAMAIGTTPDVQSALFMPV